VSQENNHISFTAADIERYHKGQLSGKQMHDLEKAALDDPFLADALEGYSTPGVNVNADIAELKRRLAAQTEETKVIPMHAGKSSFPWLRVAVMIVLIAGAGLLSYQFLFKTNSNEIAQAPKQQNKESVKINEQVASQPQANDKDTTLTTTQVSTSPALGSSATANKNLDSVVVPTNQWKAANGTASTEPAISKDRSIVGETNKSVAAIPGKKEEKEIADLKQQKPEALTEKTDITLNKANDLDKTRDFSGKADDNLSYGYSQQKAS
jgi:hypothetical protein